MTEYTKDDSQVDVQAICKKHNIGRYKLIEASTFVARVLGMRPHDALKKLLEVEDLEQYLKEVKSKSLDLDLRDRLRKV
tara:strand:- start:3791 stop:4027 length:237 start_codon:yes stop_codon:yes gene_type:complete